MTTTLVPGIGKATQATLDEAAASPGRWSKSMVKAWTRQVELIDLAATMIAATNRRCACGDHGDWSCSVSGTSGDKPCVWAGCPNCSGQAIGVPVSRDDFRRWLKLPASEKASYVAHAVCLGTRSKKAKVDMDALDSTIDAQPVK